MLGYVTSKLIITVVFSALLGVFLERFCYRVIIDGPPINIFILALGLMFIFENACQMIWGADPVSVQLAGNTTLSLGPISITKVRLIIIIVNIVVLIGLALILKFTKLGRAIRAMAQNKDAAAMVGVNTNRTSSAVFAIGSALAGLCGVLVTSILTIFPTYGGGIVVKGFAVMIVGGLGSIPGVLVGGLFLGLAETLGAAYLSAAFKDAYGFIILLLVLLFKPEGLFGGGKKKRKLSK